MFFSVCFPFFGWNKYCWKAWGIWIGCPKWNSCFKKIPNLICLAECALKRIASAFIAWVEQTIQKVRNRLHLYGVNNLMTFKLNSESKYRSAFSIGFLKPSGYYITFCKADNQDSFEEHRMIIDVFKMV